MNQIVPTTRWLLRCDHDQVMAIEQESFEFPWRSWEFTRALARSNAIGRVCQVGPAIAGFMVFELFKQKIVLENIAVALDCRGNGIGRLLIEDLKRKLHPGRRERLSLIVRETNVDAQLFFRACGLQFRRAVPQPFEETREDGYRFEFRVVTPGGFVPRRDS